MDEPDNESKDEGLEACCDEPKVTNAELVELCAVDNDLFATTFFPRAARNDSPPFHAEMDKLLDSEDRLVCEQIFRGGAKTTKFRIYMAKRIAYGLSRTILLVSKSQGHSTKTLMWLRNAIERNTKFAQTFGLSKGSKWNDEELEIKHGVDGHVIWIIGIGITGSTRGINYEDYRPDLILVDDVVDKENSATPEARNKIQGLVHGDLIYALAPKIDNPYSKLVILQTPLAHDDVSERAFKDPRFKCYRQGCWTHETQDLELKDRKSAWEARFPTEDLIATKIAAIETNELSTFSAEMECKLVSAETASFRAEWLQYYGDGYEEPMPPLHELVTTIAIDPVPPPSPQQIAKGLLKKDYESFAVLGKWARTGRIYVLEISYNRGHNPDWTVAEFIRLAQKWQPINITVESVAYQRVLAWLFRMAMMKLGRYWPINEMTDRRAKHDRIVQGLKGVSSEKKLFVRPEMTEFISQFTLYPDVPHDDVIESVAVGAADLQGQILSENAGEQQVLPNEDNIPELEYHGGCP